MHLALKVFIKSNMVGTAGTFENFRRHGGVLVAVGDTLVEITRDYRRGMLAFKKVWLEHKGGSNIDPARLEKLAAGVDTHLSHLGIRLAETGVKLKSDHLPVTSTRASPEYKSASDHSDHVFAAFFEDTADCAMFLVSSRSHKYMTDVTCSSAGTVPKDTDEWRTVVGFDKSNGSTDDATNTATALEAHGPAVMARLRDYVRHIAWMSQRLPNINVVMSKLDISKAFKNIPVALASVNRLATQLNRAAVIWPSPQVVIAAIACGGYLDEHSAPTAPTAVVLSKVHEAVLTAVPQPAAIVADGHGPFGGLVIVGFYLCLPFGWSASPANYSVFGWTLNSAHCNTGPPADAMGSAPELPFYSLTHMDDTMMLEWDIGDRTEYATESIFHAVEHVFHLNAANMKKFAKEGDWDARKTCMGIDIDLRRICEGIEFCVASMPELKQTKLRDLLGRPEWQAGCITQTMRQLQTLAGVVQFQATTSPAMISVLPALWQAMTTTTPGWVAPPGDSDEQLRVHDELAEGVVLLKCIASADWADCDHFKCPLIDVIPPLERIQCGLALRKLIIGSDATGEDPVRDCGRKSVMCVTDFSEATWFAAATEKYFDLLRAKCGKFSDKLIVYIAELMPVVALACQRGAAWSGYIVVAVIDNDNARRAINRRKSRNRYARYLLAILTLLEVKYKFRIVAYYVNTENNLLNDTISRVFEPDSATAIVDTQRVIDTMATGLRWEPLTEILDFFTSDEHAMITFSLPCESVGAPAAGFLTPFGQRWRNATAVGTVAGGASAAVGATTTVVATGAAASLPLVSTPAVALLSVTRSALDSTGDPSQPLGKVRGAVFEHCGGLLNLSREFVKLGAEHAGYTETCSVTVKAMELRAPAAVCYGDFFHQDWRCERPQQAGARWLVAGPPCTPFSGAGKQLGARDGRTALFFAVAKIAEHHRPEFIDVEETEQISILDGGECVGALDVLLSALGYVRTPRTNGRRGVEVVCPANTLRASPQIRPRVILHYERGDVFELLGPCPLIAVVRAPPRVLRDFLMPVEAVSLNSRVAGTFRPQTQVARVVGVPFLVGHVYLGGDKDPVAAGALVRLKAPHDSLAKYRVLSSTGSALWLLLRDKASPKRFRVSVSEVLEHCESRRPVYSIDGPTFAVKAWGEPLEGAGGILCLDVRMPPDLGLFVRPLDLSECWQLQELDEPDAVALRAAPGASSYAMHRACGNCVATSVAEAVAVRSVGRGRQIDHLRAAKLAVEAQRLGRGWRVRCDARVAERASERRARRVAFAQHEFARAACDMGRGSGRGGSTAATATAALERANEFTAREREYDIRDGSAVCEDRAGGGPRGEEYKRGPYTRDDIDPVALDNAVAMLVTQSLAVGTHETYGSHWKQWLLWRETRGQAPLLNPAEGIRALEQELIDLYAFFGVLRGLAYETVHVRLYAIKRLHLENDIDLDFAKMPRLRMVQRGMKRLGRGPVRKLAISVDMLRDILAHGELDLSKWDDLLKFTAMNCGFFFLLRSCEYLRTEHGADPEKCIRMEHLTFSRDGVKIRGDGRLLATRMTIFIPFSKTDVVGEGVTLTLDVDSGNPLCVVTLFNRLRVMNPARFAARNGGDHVFRTRSGRVLHKHHVQKLLKGGASRAGFNPKDFTSHSLRAGGASAMYHNGFTVEEIQRRGRWASDVWKIYIQGNSAEAAAMTKRMSNNSTILPERLKSWA